MIGIPAAWRLASALLALAACAAAMAQESVAEREVKAAFLFRFAGYVEWPEHAFARPDSPIVIAVAGNDAVYEQLVQTVAGRSMGRRPVMARRLQKGEPVSAAHMLFVGAGAGDGPVPPGSVINFAVTDNRVRFDVSMEAAEANGLRLSARLLSVARQVRGRPS